MGEGNFKYDDNVQSHTNQPSCPDASRTSLDYGEGNGESDTDKLVKIAVSEFLKTKANSKSTRSAVVKDLPKVEYSKLVNLSLTNLDEYLVSIYNLGYSRFWPIEFYQPMLKNLQSHIYYPQDEDLEKSSVRREAYLVLLNTIPPSLKYLVREVQSGDVLGIWKAIFDRFFHITPDKKRALQQEWDSLSMESLKMTIDKFVAHIYLKAGNLGRYGIHKEEQELVETFVAGLSKEFDWFRHHRRLFPTRVTLKEAVKCCIDYAHDNQMLKAKDGVNVVSDQSGNTLPKAICRNFNSEKGCTRNPCPYKHEKFSKTQQKKNKNLGKKILPVKAEGSNTSGGKQCFGCGSYDHLLNKCPKKDEWKAKQTEAINVVTQSDPVRHALPILSVARSENKPWVIDSAAACHITAEWADLFDVRPLHGAVEFTVGNDTTMVPSHVGSVQLGSVVLSEVYFCPECPVKLMSEVQLMRKGVTTCNNNLWISVKFL